MSIIDASGRFPPDPDAMKTIPCRVVARDTGEEVAAVRAVCECGGDHWHVFQIEGHNHVHLQCVHCEESYCPGGACK